MALGVFDGVHRGHSRILKETAAKAQRLKGTSLVLTFWPHPQRQESLISLKHRLSLIEQFGIDICIAVNFNKNFADISAADFVKRILFKKLGARYIYIGRNFNFGRNAKGNFKTLKKLSKIFNFRLKVFEVVKINNRTISSSYIRTLIRKGRLNEAKKLLGRSVSIMGTVIKGSSLAKELGFPTANIDPHHEIVPPSGVYAVKVLLSNARARRALNGVCNIGVKPTFKQSDERYIEVYIFNFAQKIYGKRLELQFIKKLREEKKFTSRAALVEQIKRDIHTAYRIFFRH